MLKSLYIKNYVLIDELDIRFDNGFSVMTGETGAGKSIILGALSLVLGERVDSRSIRTGSEKCVIEAVFDISAYQLHSFFEDNDLEFADTVCLLRRELYSTGKSRAFINDTPTSLSIIKNLGTRLIDIHSQHRNLLLTDARFQLNIVDLFTKTENQLSGYGKEYENYLSVCKTLDALQDKARKTKEDEEYIHFQFDELIAAKLKVGEQDELEREMDMLSHTEEIKIALFKVTELLTGEAHSVAASLREALTAVEQISHHYQKANGFAERIRSAYMELYDIALETNVLKDDIEFNPERLDYVNNRINALYSLQQKHRVNSVDELINKRDAYCAQLALIDSYDEELDRLSQKKQALYRSLVQKAAEITALRKRSAKTIERQLTDRMIILGVPNTRFQIDFAEKPAPAADGMDDVNFLFAANKNEPLKPVALTASGGEISRLMLCVKSMIAGHSALPTIIFDEIDTGVSGEIADKMAGIMQDLGKKMQVITITHVPQIAAKGTAHYFVYKEDTSERTLTYIRRLTDSERIDEIARMLSGSEKTQAAVDNAKDLLKISL